ncbi:LysR family transcriptional regulator [Oceanibacterium hippocampi]|uniref:HTH-type transcriptional regulator DmlR n=1 Tax=Oceanibacterium hippocampi TaxID=745714 RepID=A0A1Y5SNA4_9PROT|nr:LysR family transcriptional regulator [Oceanibacterium hippocampi]SLN41554.1 HTH-type transcriptional regulator DmlR [Oceanibacterium hippocampi]
MDELTCIRTFLQVVEAGSFSAVARQKNTTASSIARQVGALEKLLGVRLINRTTRTQNLTDPGHLYYQQMAGVIGRIDNINTDVSSYQKSVKGMLRVQLRTSVATEVILPEIPRFLRENPELSLDIQLSDETIDLIKNQIDVAVWLGKLDDSSNVARRLSKSHRVVCGSPAYFAEHGTPKHPAELAEHNCLIYKGAHYRSTWAFAWDGKSMEISVSGNMQTSSSTVLMKAAVNGLGIMVTQEWMARQAIANGDLVRVLDQYEVSPTTQDTALYAVYPHGHRISPNTRAFVDFLVSLFTQDNGCPEQS